MSFTLNERGMFPKVWSLNRQKNYWNASLNGGLPIVKKRDPIHEGTFMLHDTFHFVFRDPLVTGRETENEKRAYIAYRMMSEACTLVLADMFSIYLGNLKDTGYDTSARQVYPLFESLSLDITKVNDLCKLLYANCIYCMYGDDAEYRELGAEEKALQLYKDKYSIFFMVDFKWNKKNIENMLESIKTIPGSDTYFDSLPVEVSYFNTHSLSEEIVTSDGKLSVERLFAVFWKQLLSVITYSSEFSPLAYSRNAVLDYVSGQIRVAYMYPNYPESETLKKSFQVFVEKVRIAQSAYEIILAYKSINNEVKEFIDMLGRIRVLLPHEVVVYKLHVSHFVPIFYSYDKPKESYIPLEVYAKEIFDGNLITSKESFITMINFLTESDQENFTNCIVNSM
jgi:hypothetical protein